MGVFTLVTFLPRSYTFKGSLIEPPVRAKDFTLTDQYGREFNLQSQRGNVVLLFFGYTHCPDVCPVTLTDYRKIIKELNNQSDFVRFVFITVDPERDTFGVLMDHLAKFDSKIIGLTGDNLAIQEVWSAYGVFHEKVDKGSAAGYLIDHTARMYLIDPDGYLRLTYPFGFEAQAITQDIQHLINQK
jgi:protein SCO1/2